jgi:negative regulator of flagellin synthesis FlgM
VKIDTSFKTTGAGSTSSRPRAESADKSGKAAATEVTLSAASSQMAGASSGAPIDGARIAEIKLAISEGRFQINAEAIADGLIDTARGLLQAQRKA